MPIDVKRKIPMRCLKEGELIRKPKISPPSTKKDHYAYNGSEFERFSIGALFQNRT